MKALVITVGTTTSPIIESIMKNDVDVVYLVYGRPLSPDQEPNPFNVAYEARQKAIELNKRAITKEISDPEDIDSCISAFREVVKEVHEFDEIIVNFTGGTKPMSAAAFHVFVTEAIPSKVIFEYVGGKVRDKNGRVIRNEMRITKSYLTAPEESAIKIINNLKTYQFHIAKTLAESLPEKKYDFLKKACNAFWLWDIFEYERAVKILNEIGKAAEVLENVAFDVVPENVIKLKNIGNKVVSALRKMRKCQNEKKILDIEGGHLLSLDALANAERRLLTHNYVEAVLRGYRAIEIATQVKLLENGVNPWKVEWSKIDESGELLKSLGYDKEGAPEQLTLWLGLRVLEFVNSKNIFDKIYNDLQYVSLLRNGSKLEHGYLDIDEEKAKKAIEKSFKIIKTILASEDFSEFENFRIFRGLS